LVAGVKAAYRAIEANLPSWSVIGSVLDLGQLISPHQHPCSAGRDYLVIDHKGHIAKCHMELNQPVTNVQHPDPLSVIRLSPVGLQNPAVQEKEDCNTCEWRYGCAGGCPIVAYRATGRYQAKSPNCNIYKTIYPEAVRLEGLRLLKFKPHSGDTCASLQ
jgi:uncharacterized protein